MVLDYFFDKNLVFCLEADNQEQLFDQVASLLEEREIVTPTYREALITREKSFPTGLDMEFLGKDLPNVAIPHTDIVHNLAEKVVVVRLEKPVTFHNMIAPGKEVEVSLLFFIINNSSSSQTNILAQLMDFFTGNGLKVLREKGYEGKELIFGIRPEDVNAEPAFLETFPDCVVKATISVSELLGSESHLYCQVGKDEFVAKVDARDYLQTGATVELGFDLNKAHFFDVETEKTIY
ncbi:PTS system transporter subunit IIA [Streptococcus pneumoniae]|nr:PTS system transporter subunit IIA [Streptococcus pneumoniae]